MSETPPTPTRIVEALLFVGGQPLTAERAGEIIRHLTPEQFRDIIDGLNRDYRKQGRPYAVQPSAQGYLLTLKPQFRAVRVRLNGSPREARLTPAALDVLAVIAYRQPIVKTDIDSQRGNDSRGPLRQLLRLGLVAIESGKVGGYITTRRFLEMFDLQSLDDLPRTGDLQQL